MAAPSELAPYQLSFPLPRALDTRVYVHLTVRAKSVLIFLTTAAADELGRPPSMGSFVYALPDQFDPSRPLSTPLFSVESSLDLTSRLARLVAKKTGLPTYVGSSLSLSGAGLGGTVEEELDAFRKVVDVVTEKLPSSLGTTNGLGNMPIGSG